MTDFSYQLYSSRNYPPLSDTLAMLAGLGYRQVEGFGALIDSVDAATSLRVAIDAAGLSMPSCHMSLDQMSDPATAIETCKVLGLKHAYVPYIAPDDRPGDAAAWAAYGAQVEKAARPLIDAGVDVGYHNHDFEFFATSGTDEVPMALILENAPSISWECDTAWIVKGGHDVLDWIERYKDRISAAHIKDIAPDGECADEDGWADVGHGTMHWVPIRSALAASSCELLIMEHDNPNDHERFARRSLAAARAV